MIDGVDYEYDDEKFLLEPVMTEEASKVIAAEEGITLTPEHWIFIGSKCRHLFYSPLVT